MLVNNFSQKIPKVGYCQVKIIPFDLIFEFTYDQMITTPSQIAIHQISEIMLWN